MTAVSTDVISSDGQEVLESIHTSFILKEFDNAREKAEDAGLVQVGEGTGRVVYSLPSDLGPSDVVVKVAKNMHGLQANQTEVHTFEHKAPAEFCEQLAPVAGKGNWVVMKKCDPGDTAAVDDLKFNLLNEGVVCAETEIRQDNIGRLNGQPVWMDYGFGFECL